MKPNTTAASLLALALLAASTTAEPLASVFTYQGTIKDGGVPATGEYDMTFALYDAPSDGTLVGGPLVFDGQSGNPAPIVLLNGIFQVDLDFGSAFEGSGLWLEVQVRPHAIGGYTPLVPRQPVTAVPYALYALGGPGGGGPWTAAGGDIHNTNAGSVGVGTDTPAAKLHVAGDIRSDGPTGVIAHNPNNTEAVAALGWFNDVARIRIGGNGAGAGGGLDIQKTGDRSLMRIYDSGDVWLRGGIDVSGNAWFQGGAVGIGTTDPGAKLHAVGDGAGTVAKFTNGGTCGGMTNTALIVGDTCGSGRAATFYGVTSNTLVSIANDGTGKAAVFGGDVAFSGGDVGIGTVNPANRLSVVGSANISARLGVGLSTPLVPVHVGGGGDTSPVGGGYIVTGDVGGANISIDNNEIMARNNGAASTLFLNAEGGDVVVGGPLNIGYQIVTGSPTANCPTGKKPISGGCRISGDAEVRASYPSGNGWTCVVGDQSGFITLTAYAICVNVK